MISANTQKWALATHHARLALLDLRKLVEEATESTHAAELEAIRSAISRRQSDRGCGELRTAVDRLRSPNLEAALSQARERLEAALSLHEQIEPPSH